MTPTDLSPKSSPWNWEAIQKPAWSQVRFHIGCLGFTTNTLPPDCLGASDDDDDDGGGGDDDDDDDVDVDDGD